MGVNEGGLTDGRDLGVNEGGLTGGRDLGQDLEEVALDIGEGRRVAERGGLRCGKGETQEVGR